MRYADVLGTLRQERDEWTAHVPEDWMQGRTVFGGLQVALAVRVMRGLVAGHLPLRNAQVTFVAPVPGETVHLVPRVLRIGRSATQARCDLLHAGQVACLVTAVFGTGRASAVSVEMDRPTTDREPPELQDMPHVEGLTPAFIQHMQLRWARGTPPFTGQEEPRTQIYVRHRDPEIPPEDALIAVADAIPTPALSMLDRPAPSSSLTWALELLDDPSGFDPAGWSLLDTNVRAAADGYLSQTSLLWGPDGRALSVSHQTVTLFG